MINPIEPERSTFVCIPKWSLYHAGFASFVQTGWVGLWRFWLRFWSGNLRSHLLQEVLKEVKGCVRPWQLQL
jgi:hypothetical protein